MAEIAFLIDEGDWSAPSFLSAHGAGATMDADRAEQLRRVYDMAPAWAKAEG